MIFTFYSEWFLKENEAFEYSQNVVCIRSTVDEQARGTLSGVQCLSLNV